MDDENIKENRLDVTLCEARRVGAMIQKV